MPELQSPGGYWIGAYVAGLMHTLWGTTADSLAVAPTSLPITPDSVEQKLFSPVPPQTAGVAVTVYVAVAGEARKKPNPLFMQGSAAQPITESTKQALVALHGVPGPSCASEAA
jgi:hypothetical protein